MNNTSLQRLFLLSAAAILMLTGLAKLYSATGTAKILGYPDAIFPVSYRQLLAAVGVLELAVGGYLWRGRQATTKLVLIIWLCSSFLVYRLGLVLLHSTSHCPCLGTVVDRLPIRPATTEAVLKGIVLYLAAGSIILLVSKRGSVRANPV